MLNGERVERSEEDWFQFEVKDRKFIGAGDPSKLGLILKTFFELNGWPPV